MFKKHLFFFVISLIFITITSCSKFQKLQKSDDIEEKYEAAVQYYENKQYYKAGILLEELIPIMRGRVEAEKAIFYYAYCHYNQKQLLLSAYYFDKLVEDYPRSDYAHEASFMNVKSKYESTAKFNLDQGDTYNTIASIQSFINRYTDSKYVEECNVMIDVLNYKLEQKAFENAKLYHKLRFYKSGVLASKIFMESFPVSKHNEELLYLRIDSQLNLAKKSVDSKKKERLLDAITYYQEYVDRFPDSEFIRDAEALYETSIKELEKINKTI